MFILLINKFNLFYAIIRNIHKNNILAQKFLNIRILMHIKINMNMNMNIFLPGISLNAWYSSSCFKYNSISIKYCVVDWIKFIFLCMI